MNIEPKSIGQRLDDTLDFTGRELVKLREAIAENAAEHAKTQERINALSSRIDALVRDMEVMQKKAESNCTQTVCTPAKSGVDFATAMYHVHNGGMIRRPSWRDHVYRDAQYYCDVPYADVIATDWKLL